VFSLASRRCHKTTVGNNWFKERVIVARSDGPTKIEFWKGAQAVGPADHPYQSAPTGVIVFVDPEELKGSVHGHDLGMKHKTCGGELYFDWTVTYEHEGSEIPAIRCANCKEEILGDEDVESPADWEVPK
jgi:hypothetical protein